MFDNIGNDTISSGQQAWACNGFDGLQQSLTTDLIGNDR